MCEKCDVHICATETMHTFHTLERSGLWCDACFFYRICILLKRFGRIVLKVKCCAPRPHSHQRDAVRVSSAPESLRWSLSTGHCAQEGRCLVDIITSPLIVTSSRSQWSTPLCPFEDIGGFVYRLSKSGNFRVACGADPFLSCVHHVL